MKKLVIMPGGFHPWHSGHTALYRAARKAFPDAEIFVAATDDTSQRPFPFKLKEKLASLAGVEPGHFVRVKSPFRAQEITQNFDPDKTTLIFVRSRKDADKPPQAGGVKRDGTPSYLQPWAGQEKPFSQHGYMAYLPTIEFAGGMRSATEIRNSWPNLDDKEKNHLVANLYPGAAKNPKMIATIVKMFNEILGAAPIREEVAGTTRLDPNEEFAKKFDQLADLARNQNYVELKKMLYDSGVLKNLLDNLIKYQEIKTGNLVQDLNADYIQES